MLIVRATPPFPVLVTHLHASRRCGTQRAATNWIIPMPTLFERIITGELPAAIVHKDERATAFRDIRPLAPTHILIVPNKPIPTANDIADSDESLIGHLFTLARDLARKEGIAENGYRLIVNCNAHGGQEVYHLHVHLLGGRPLGPMLTRT
jgi:histidine triad (HIT) family protein